MRSSHHPGSTGTPVYGTRHAEAGFTLLEIMVAMLILSMIVTTAFGALRLGERSWEAGVARAAETETLRTITGLLQRQLGQALYLAWKENAETHIAFSGEPTEVRFIGPAPRHRTTGGLYEYTLAVEQHAEGARLVLYYRLHDPDHTGFQPDDSNRIKVLLVDDLEGAEFSYYGMPGDGDEPQWHTQWSSRSDFMPQMLRARLTARDDRQPWPELLFALHAGRPQ